MQRLAEYILDTYFTDILESHGEVLGSPYEGIKLMNLVLRHEKMTSARSKQEFGLEITAGTIGSLQFKATELGKVSVIASDVVFNLKVEPMKAIGSALWNPSRAAEADAKRPGFVRPATEEWSGYKFNALLGRCTSTPVDARRPKPLFCALHHAAARRRRGPIRNCDCQVCHVKLQTNYVQCMVCAGCSRNLSRCVVCGDTEVFQSRRDLEDDVSVRNGDIDETICKGLICGTSLFNGGQNMYGFGTFCHTAPDLREERQERMRPRTPNISGVFNAGLPTRPGNNHYLLNSMEQEITTSIGSVTLDTNPLNLHDFNKFRRIKADDDVPVSDPERDDVSSSTKMSSKSIGGHYDAFGPRSCTAHGGSNMVDLDSIISDREELQRSSYPSVENRKFRCPQYVRSAQDDIVPYLTVTCDDSQSLRCHPSHTPSTTVSGDSDSSRMPQPSFPNRTDPQSAGGGSADSPFDMVLPIENPFEKPDEPLFECEDSLLDPRETFSNHEEQEI